MQDGHGARCMILCYYVQRKCKQEIRENYCTVQLYTVLRFMTFEIQNTSDKLYVQCINVNVIECNKIVIIEELLMIQCFPTRDESPETTVRN